MAFSEGFIGWSRDSASKTIRGAAEVIWTTIFYRVIVITVLGAIRTSASLGRMASPEICGGKSEKIRGYRLASDCQVGARWPPDYMVALSARESSLRIDHSKHGRRGRIMPWFTRFVVFSSFLLPAWQYQGTVKGSSATGNDELSMCWGCEWVWEYTKLKQCSANE